ERRNESEKVKEEPAAEKKTTNFRREWSRKTTRTEKPEKAEERKPAPAKAAKEEPAADIGKKIIVIVNQKPIVMRGKESYMFVDIFDYIDFDTSRMQGSGIATLVNGKDAQYTQELYNGDKIEVYWK
ncbi:MAG: hypothetical protein K2P39_10460, partial [Lachnospiraceae bacterium]|nr:hypothetical protein [Lachnospiraceae bacterium]